mmetsp:Transcript_49301/g.142875  ORF Transcript_49301/g.142875 Transcript_49301/m.142875 type:complete len:207 (+) Transcript_49301:314-934(+)
MIEETNLEKSTPRAARWQPQVHSAAPTWPVRPSKAQEPGRNTLQSPEAEPRRRPQRRRASLPRRQPRRQHVPAASAAEASRRPQLGHSARRSSGLCARRSLRRRGEHRSQGRQQLPVQRALTTSVVKAAKHLRLPQNTPQSSGPYVRQSLRTPIVRRPHLPPQHICGVRTRVAMAPMTSYPPSISPLSSRLAANHRLPRMRRAVRR